MRLVHLVAFAPILACLAACGEALEDDVEETEADISTAKLETFHFFAPAPLHVQQAAAQNGTCAPSGWWMVDLAPARISGSVCVDGERKPVGHDLTPAEVGKIKTALRGLKSTKVKLAACDENAAGMLLQVTRNGTMVQYVDTRSACWTDGKVITATTMDRLRAVIEDAGAP